ncbi:MAG: flavin reductase family protein [Saprospiraceae bacterium]|nr:flavin reductase family protein [Saprospiraceae bacterium]
MNFKKLLKRLRFNFTTAEYMRVAYLSPRKVVMVTTRLKDKDNVLPIDWHMPVSFEPKLYAVCLERNNHSAKTIRLTGEFVVNFVGAELEDKILLCGRSSGKDIDKFDLSDLGRQAASQVKAAILTEASGYLECKVIEVREWGDHTVFVGKVLREELLKGQTPELYHVTKF